MQIGDTVYIGDTQYKVTDIETVQNEDGTESVIVSYSPVA